MSALQVVAVIVGGGTLAWVLFGDLFWNVRIKVADARAKKALTPLEQAVIVHLRGRGLPAEVYEKYDLSTLEAQLRAVIKKSELGLLDGNEVGPEGTVIYMYGPDAERLFGGVESVLKAYPLCQDGLVVIRRGPPGAPEREVALA